MKNTLRVWDLSSSITRLSLAVLICFLSPGFEAYSAFAHTLELKDSAAQTRILGDVPTETGSRIQTDIPAVEVQSVLQGDVGDRLDHDFSEPRHALMYHEDNQSDELLGPEIQTKSGDPLTPSAAANATSKGGSGIVAARKKFSIGMRKILTAVGRAADTRSPDLAVSEIGVIYGDQRSIRANVPDATQTSGRFNAWKQQLIAGRSFHSSWQNSPQDGVVVHNRATAPKTASRPMSVPTLTVVALAGIAILGLPDILHAATAAGAAISGSAGSIDPIINGIVGAISGVGNLIGNGFCYLYPATIAYQQISGKAKPDEKSPWRIFLGLAGSVLMGGISAPLEHMQEGGWATLFWGVQNWAGILLLLSPPLVTKWLKKTGTVEPYRPIEGRWWGAAQIRHRWNNDVALRRTAIVIAVAAGAAAVISLLLHYFIVPAVASWYWGVPLASFGPMPQSVSHSIDAIRENVQWIASGLYFGVFLVELIQRAVGKKAASELPPGYASLYTIAMIGFVLWNASEAYLIGHKLASEGVADWTGDHGWRQKMVYAVQSFVIGVSSYISYRLQPKGINEKATGASLLKTAEPSLQAGKNAEPAQKQNEQAGPSALNPWTPPDPWASAEHQVIIA